MEELCWYSKECVCCACDSSVRLVVPSIGFLCVYVRSNILIYELKSGIKGVYSPHV